MSTVRRRFTWLPRSLRVITLGSTLGLLVAIAHWTASEVQAQTSDGGTITLKADVQEANAITGVVTARGNVQIDYPTRDIYATSAQAQYFSEERRIILSGDVVVLQEGNRLEAETVTYLIDEGRFVALPQPNQQVRTTYIVPPSEPAPAAAADSDSAASSSVPANEDDLTAPFEPDATLDTAPLEPRRPRLELEEAEPEAE